jgi:hypothetical protein
LISPKDGTLQYLSGNGRNFRVKIPCQRMAIMRSEALSTGGYGWPEPCRRVRATNVSFLEIQLGPGTA